MSDISKVPLLLPKCLPNINSIYLKDDSIQRLGGTTINSQGKNGNIAGNFLILSQPLQIGNKLINIEEWLLSMLKICQNSLRNYFRWDKISSKNCPFQVSHLKEEVEFTLTFEEILELD